VSLKSRNRLNLALLAAVGILAALAWYRPGTRPELPGQPLSSAPAAGARAIRITLADKPPLVFLKDAAGWRMTAPLSFPADAYEIQTLLTTLDAARGEPVTGAGADLAPYGLAKPLMRLSVDGRDYLVGGEQPVSRARYLLAEGKLVVADDALLSRVAHDAYWWLDKQLLPPGARITALQLPHATLSRGKDGRWQLAPADDTVSADAIQGLLDRWQETRALSVEPLDKLPAEGEVAVALAGVAEPVRFVLLKDPDYLVLARPDLGLEYQLDPALRASLLGFTRPAPAPH
jgi:hypothetical protein